MTFTMRWRVGSPVLPPEQSVIIRTASGGAPRMGQTVSVENRTGLPCYVQVLAPGTDNYDGAWVDLDLYNPEPAFTLDWQHLGHRLRVIARGVDSLGRPNGQDVVSNEIGPVLHAVDPVGTTVSNPTEFNNAVAVNGATVILAAGTTWAMQDLSRNMNGVTITTPQDNPARIMDSTLVVPGNRTWTNVTFEGLIFRQTAAYATAINPANGLPNRGTALLTTNSLVTGFTMNGCKHICDNVPPSVYLRRPPADLTQGEYWNTGGVPTMCSGMDLHRSPGVTIRGYFARNNNRTFVLPHRRTIRHLRIHGWYGDGVQILGTFSTLSDVGSTRDFYISHCYAVYNEQDVQAPHPDAIQTTVGDGANQTFDGFAQVIGNTRALASTGPINNFIIGARLFRSRFRRILGTGSGSINFYNSGGDLSWDQTTRLELGFGAASMRFGGSGAPNTLYENEARVHRMLARGNFIRVDFGGSTSRYFVETDSATNLGNAISDVVVATDLTVVPDTLSDVALLARPKVETTRGALLPSGHMRPFVEFPSVPSMTVFPLATSFNASLTEVDGAQAYELRYRLTGTTGPWTRLTSTETDFSPTVAAGTYDVQCHVQTAAGLSGWSAVQTVTVG